MSVRTVVLLVVLMGIALFAAVNWGAFTTPTRLSLVVTSFQAPLGLIMLGVTALLTALFLVFVVYLQTSVLLEARRHARELQAQRTLADQAEASRFTELRTFLDARLLELEGKSAEVRTGMLERMNQIERDLRTAVEQAANALAAYIGEFEDRMERKAGGNPRDAPG